MASLDFPVPVAPITTTTFSFGNLTTEQMGVCSKGARAILRIIFWLMYVRKRVVCDGGGWFATVVVTVGCGCG
ncbi:hypothetical protein Hanom_Chr03g00267151 [Helianthus anomalus]